MKKRNKIDMFHFTRLTTADTGLPVDVLVEERYSGNKRPRIIVMKKPCSVHISDSVDIYYEHDTPEIIRKGLLSKYYDKVIGWIELNKAVLMSHWNFKISSKELFEQIKKL